VFRAEIGKNFSRGKRVEPQYWDGFVGNAVRFPDVTVRGGREGKACAPNNAASSAEPKKKPSQLPSEKFDLGYAQKPSGPIFFGKSYGTLTKPLGNKPPEH